MTTLEREPDRNLDYVVGRLDGVLDALQDVKTGIQGLSLRIDQTNERIDKTNERIDQTNERIDKLTLALFGFGGALVVTVIGGMIALGWAILQSA